MGDGFRVMLAWHAQHNHSEEIRAVASEMLGMIQEQDAERAHNAASGPLVHPQARAAYINSLPGTDVAQADIEQDQSVFHDLETGIRALFLFGVGTIGALLLILLISIVRAL